LINTITEIIAKFAGKRPTKEAHLFDEGYLDSLGFLGMVEELENYFNVEMTPELMNEENFSNLEQIELTITQLQKR